MNNAFRQKFSDIDPNWRIGEIWRGTVVETQGDPLHRGRIRIRIFGRNTAVVNKNYPEGIPDSELPWAEQVAPTMGGSSGAGAFAVPTVGSIVWGFFANGDPMFPMYFGVQMGMTASGGGGGGSGSGEGGSGSGEQSSAESQPSPPADINVKGECELAKEIGCDPCTIRALGMQESNGRSNVLRVESGDFAKELAKKVGPNKFYELKQKYPKLLSSMTNRTNSCTNADCLRQAMEIDPAIAVNHTSFGKYQVTGHPEILKSLGVTPEEYIKMGTDPDSQEKLLSAMIRAKARHRRGSLQQALKDNDWVKICTIYNGGGACSTNLNTGKSGKRWTGHSKFYDQELQEKYEACKKAPPNCNAEQQSSSQSSTPPSTPEATSISVEVVD